MAPTLRLQDLSSEIQSLIIDNVLRPSDLKNVCLVSKHLHELAVKPLYRYVPLDLGSAKDQRLSAFLNPRNKGLQHIRRIRLYLAGVPDKCNQDKQAELVIRMLLEFLPEDILEEFSWCPWQPFSADNLALLYKKQKKMRWLECMDMDRDFLPQLKKDTRMQESIFKAARQISIYPENRETLRLGGFFVEKTADHVEDLAIHADFLKNPDHRIDPGRNSEYIDPRELNDTATAPGLLMSTIFANMLPFDKCEPFQRLKTLRLDTLNLRNCDISWCKIVNFTAIESLRIHSCTGADSLLGQLSKATNLPKQLKVFHLQHVDNADNEALLALDGFLCLTSGIKELVIDLKHVDSMPAAAGIARHGKTLELLNIHCSPSSIAINPDEWADELAYSSDDFAKICESCTNLEQLSCAWPLTSLIRPPTDEWVRFEDALEQHLKDLVTLQISNFPHNKPSSQSLPRTIYEQLLQGLTLRLFQPPKNTITEDSQSPEDGTSPTPEATTETNQPQLPTPPQSTSPNNTTTPTVATTTTPPHPRRSKLRLVAFGISNRIYEREDSKYQLIYLRSTSQAADGKTQPFAARVSWCLRKYLEPRSDILDIILDRGSKTPWKDSGGSVAGLGHPWGDEDEFDDA